MFHHAMNRREFAIVAGIGMGAGLAGIGMGSGSPGAGDVAGAEPGVDAWNPDRPLVAPPVRLKVQPVLMHTTFRPREKTSWRSWGSIHTPEAAREEAARIDQELRALAAQGDFGCDLLPLRTVTSPEEARPIHETDYDVMLVYPASGSGTMLTACMASRPDRDTILFVRHRSGPIYYWYEALSTRYLKKVTEEEVARRSARDHGGPSVDDVVVDAYGELKWRLRALVGLKNFVGQRIVALGGAGGKYDPQAPQVARDRFQLQIIEVSYEELAKRLQAVRADSSAMAQADQCTDRYLALPQTRLATQRTFVRHAFLLYRIFKDWMREHRAWAFTIGQCMSTVIPMAETTACLSLSWLNDEGWAAFCESDFVIIPAGILLRAIAGTPVFLHNSTFPHRGMVTCAHCTAPRRMDGKRYEPVEILTHYESDYGAAPKVEMPTGQQVTFIDPEYATGRWVGFRGVIRDNPSFPICRTQQDVEIQGDWQSLLPEVRDSHWVMAYGDHLQAVGYAARKIGIRWVDRSGPNLTGAPRETLHEAIS